MIAEIGFWFFVSSVFYTFLGYPLAIFLLSRLFPRPIRKDDFWPSVSIIIAAYNEERDLRSKLDNMLSLDYPKDKLEIVVASDCSSDDTDEIVRSYANRGVILHRQETRQGKTRAQQQAVKISTGEILVFSDATTIFELDAVSKIVRSFADPEVGCVAGRLTYVDRTSTAVGKGCRSYWGYEKFLKACESRLGSLIGVSGCLYAVRRICQARLANQMIDDFVIATEIRLQGLRTVYEPEAISTEDTNNKGQDELRMRIRVISQTIRALNRYREIFSLAKHGMFAFQMFSHKVLRYVVPVFLVGALVSNWFLIEKSIYYKYTFLAQVVFYFSTVVGWGAERMKVKIGPLAIPYYFLLVNVASVAGFMRFIVGETQVVWEPIRENRIPKVATDSLAKPQLAGKST
jgi:cellulose synthase/poly-beta-1,6-N-acetylglucosamine synthase-like glycosyltransferase